MCKRLHWEPLDERVSDYASRTGAAVVISSNAFLAVDLTCQRLNITSMLLKAQALKLEVGCGVYNWAANCDAAVLGLIR